MHICLKPTCTYILALSLFSSHLLLNSSALISFLPAFLQCEVIRSETYSYRRCKFKVRHINIAKSTLQYWWKHWWRHWSLVLKSQRSHGYAQGCCKDFFTQAINSPSKLFKTVISLGVSQLNYGRNCLFTFFSFKVTLMIIFWFSFKSILSWHGALHTHK